MQNFEYASPSTLKEAAGHVDSMLKKARFTDEELEEVARDFRTWRKKTRNK